MRRYFWFSIGCITSSVAMEYFRYPFITVFVTWAGVTLLLFAESKTDSVKIILVNLCLAFSIMACAETLLWLFPDTNKVDWDAPDNYYRVMPFLGYGPIPNVKANVQELHGADLLYDVTYTIDSHGFRFTPSPTESRVPAILFFGCSFTFGEGVEDQSAMPYQVESMTKGQYRVLNLGFHGYGPHQMLAALEHNIMDRALQSSIPKYVIYQCIPTHTLRSAGLASWESGDGPQYILTKDKTVVATGPFNNNWQYRFVKHFRNQIEKSSIVQRFPEWELPTTTREHANLLVAIVAKARDYVKVKWPDAKFSVLLWNDNTRSSRLIQKGLLERNVQLFLITEALPESTSTPEQYQIPLDHHPNALAHKRIAEFVIRRILIDDVTHPVPDRTMNEVPKQSENKMNCPKS
jgi:hypothetical protein